jgi:hypothetical protein
MNSLEIKTAIRSAWQHQLPMLRERANRAQSWWRQRPNWLLPLAVALAAHAAVVALPLLPNGPGSKSQRGRNAADSGVLLDITQQLLSEDRHARSQDNSLQIPEADVLPPPPPDDLTAQLEPTPQPLQDVLPSQVIRNAVTAAAQAPSASMAARVDGPSVSSVGRSPLDAASPAGSRNASGSTPPPPPKEQTPPEPTNGPAANKPADKENVAKLEVESVDKAAKELDPAAAADQLWADATPVEAIPGEELPTGTEVRSLPLSTLFAVLGSATDGQQLGGLQVKLVGDTAYLLRSVKP